MRGLRDHDNRFTSEHLAELQGFAQLRIDKVSVEPLNPVRRQVLNRNLNGKLSFSELHDFGLDLALGFNPLLFRQISHIKQKLLSNLECESLHLTRLSLLHLRVVCLALAHVNFGSVPTKLCLSGKTLGTMLALVWKVVVIGRGIIIWLDGSLDCRFFPRSTLIGFIPLKSCLSFAYLSSSSFPGWLGDDMVGTPFPTSVL